VPRCAMLVRIMLFATSIAVLVAALLVALLSKKMELWARVALGVLSTSYLAYHLVYGEPMRPWNALLFCILGIALTVRQMKKATRI